jgi:hypothetical protein
MDAASLIQLAKARGVDLSYIGGVASNLDGVAGARRLTRKELKFRNENKLSLDVHETVKGRESRTYRRPSWSGAELGQAAKGLGVVPWNAALYSYAGAREAYLLLLNALRSEAIRIARREFWVIRVPTEDGRMKFYCEELAQLILDEDANKHLFLAAPVLYSAYMGVTQPTWERHLSGPFKSLRGCYDGWLGAARATIRRWICEPVRSDTVDKANVCV